MAIIETVSLVRRFGEKRAVDSVSLSVAEGCLFGFLGPNGEGKTTTIRVLMGLLRASEGNARMFGRDCWRESAAIKAEVGYLAGDVRLPGWMRGVDLLRSHGAIRGRDLSEMGRTLASRFGLDLRLRAGRMSRGTRQKLGLVMALAHRPRLLILDEPTSGLDPLVQDEFRALLKEWSTAGHTIFFSSHALSEVEQLCDRVAIVREGRIVADETLDRLRAAAGHDVTVRWKVGGAPAGEGGRGGGGATWRREGDRWLTHVDGSLAGLLAWLHAHSGAVDDLSVSRPDLESLFRRYYMKDDRGAAEGGR